MKNFLAFLWIFNAVKFTFALVTDQGFDVTKYPGEKCLRDCNDPNQLEPRICYFKWHLEQYITLGGACGTCGKPNATLSDCFNVQCITADGYERGVMSINRQIPGPAIHVCKNDLIVVDVVNQMGGTAATIHWHGLHQRATPWMDGVPFITQCPIDFASTFRYSFYATEPGTQFYHSHTGHHKVNGLYGGLVVRRPISEDPNGKLYNRDLPEHLIVLSDWMKELGEEYMPGLRDRNRFGTAPTNALINGKGVMVNASTLLPIVQVPLAFFRVERGLRYRFRLVNAMSHVCPIQIEIEGHKMQVISSDSFDLQPVTVDRLILNSGERFDVVVYANQPNSDYWIRVKLMGFCELLQLHQFALLTYQPKSVNDIALSFPNKEFSRYTDVYTGTAVAKTLNDPTANCSKFSIEKANICVSDLQSYTDRPDITDVPYDVRFVLGFETKILDPATVFGKDIYEHFVVVGTNVDNHVINNITLTTPPFSILTQPENINSETFCDENNLPAKCNGRTVCPCLHRLKIPLNSIVEFVIVDEFPIVSGTHHPFHLHGYQLFVKSMGQHPDVPMTVQLAKEILDAESEAPAVTADAVTKPRKYPMKDTISIQSKGFTVVRFKADNPGFWLLHCHFEWHAAGGMGLVVQVGEPNQMVPPPVNFPKCNVYTPNLLKPDQSKCGTFLTYNPATDPRAPERNGVKGGNYYAGNTTEYIGYGTFKTDCSHQGLAPGFIIIEKGILKGPGVYMSCLSGNQFDASTAYYLENNPALRWVPTNSIDMMALPGAIRINNFFFIGRVMLGGVYYVGKVHFIGNDQLWVYTANGEKSFNQFEILVCSSGPVTTTTTPKPTTTTPKPTTTTTTTTISSRDCTKGLVAGECIYPGDVIYSCYNCFLLTLLYDGNLAIYTTSDPIKSIWNSGSLGNGIVRACMQNDGNFVLYAADNVAKWSTGTFGNPGAHLELQYDGQMAIWKDGRSLWVSGVVANCVSRPNKIPMARTIYNNNFNRPCNQSLVAGECLTFGDLVYSCFKCYKLTLLFDGVLTLYSDFDKVRPNVATMDTAGKGVTKACMQSDGNFVLYTAKNQAIWATGTQNNPGAHLEVQWDGKLAVWSGGVSKWASGRLAGATTACPSKV